MSWDALGLLNSAPQSYNKVYKAATSVRPIFMRVGAAAHLERVALKMRSLEADVINVVEVESCGVLARRAPACIPGCMHTLLHAFRAACIASCMHSRLHAFPAACTPSCMPICLYANTFRLQSSIVVPVARTSKKRGLAWLLSVVASHTRVLAIVRMYCA